MRWLLRLFLFFLVFGSVGFLLLFYFPGLWIRPATLAFVLDRLDKVGISLEHEGASWQGYAAGVFGKGIRLKARKLCYPSSSAPTHFCAEGLDLDVVVDVLKLRAHFKNVSADRIEALLGPSEPAPAPAPAREDPLALPAWLSRLKLDRVAIAAWEVKSTGAPEWHFSGRLETDQEKLSVRARGAVRVETTRLPVQVVLDGTVTPEEVRARLSGETELAPWGIEKVALDQCSLKLRPGDALGVSFDCPFSVTSSKLALEPVLKIESTIAPPLWNVARANLIVPGGADWGLGAEIHASADSRGPWKADWKIAAENFSRLVDALGTTTYAIPAPINALGGSADVSGNAHGDLNKLSVESSFTATTQLQSDQQAIHSKTSGHFALSQESGKPVARLTAESKIDDSTLVLPQFDLGALPRFFPDPSIIHKKVQRTTRAFAFDYDVKVRTAPNQKFYLRSAQMNADVPLQIDLRFRPRQGTTGKIHTPRFPVEFFRRKADVHHVTVRFPEEAEPELSARVDIDYTDYQLTLTAVGKLNDPKFSLRADPPLSENSAYALLLFGRPLEELSAGQTDSVAAAQSAIAGGAVSALSMYLLASTPIESIGYEPSSGRFLATIRLGAGTSFRWEGQKEGWAVMGVRRRLGRGFSISTDIRRESMSDDHRSVSSFLEWTKTY